MAPPSCTCGHPKSSQKKGIWSRLWDGGKAAFNAIAKGPLALKAMGFTARGVHKGEFLSLTHPDRRRTPGYVLMHSDNYTGSVAASIQSKLYCGTTNGLFSHLQSTGARAAAVAPAVWAALNLPYVAWEVYKALYQDGDNPELWQALEECAGCAAGECRCGDDCKCGCKRRARGAWARLKEFLCSSTFVDCSFIVLSVVGAAVTVDAFMLFPLIYLVPSVYKSVRRNFLSK